MNRRTFLKIAGIGSLSIAAGCTSDPEKTIYSLVQASDDMVTGKANWYASTCRECPAGCGILAKNREGRIIKIEGNPLHPINEGRICMRGQAALQGLYNPDRIKTPLIKRDGKWHPISFKQAEFVLGEKAGEAAGKGSNRVRLLTEPTGEILMGLFEKTLRGWGSEGPLIFEPFAFESLKTANQKVFGLDGLVAYRMEEADLLVSFGADFLETWLSPVAYARKFAAMHSLREGKKGLFFHVSPYRLLTGANADLWISCKPAGEPAVVLGLIRELMKKGRGKAISEPLRLAIEKTALPYPREKVIQVSGVAFEQYDKLITHLSKSEKPLILGTGTCPSGPNALQTDTAVNLLNCILDPDLRLFDFKGRHRIEIASRRSHILNFLNDLENDLPDLLLLNHVNPVYSLPATEKVTDLLRRKALFVVSFSNSMDETTSLADMILPVALPLESWDTYEGTAGLISTMQPAMGGMTGAPHIGDLFLRLSSGEMGSEKGYRAYIFDQLLKNGFLKDEKDWVAILQRGGRFEGISRGSHSSPKALSDAFLPVLKKISPPPETDYVLTAAPSIRFFDGRGANRPWLCEIPDTLTQISWDTPVLMHPETLKKQGLKEGEIIRLKSGGADVEVPAVKAYGVRPGTLVMGMGQGHKAYGRYAEGMGANPVRLLPPGTDAESGAPFFMVHPVSIQKTGRAQKLPRMAGSLIQHGRNIALTISLEAFNRGEVKEKRGLSMDEFPLTLPLAEGYARDRDIYKPHAHEKYRWAMVVDLDKCIGCGACAAACYAENNIGIVGLERIVQQREMSWLTVQRYHDPEKMERVTFLPMFCQHCDNAPCESVCPVYAPHHSKEGLNNQIYNRCIGTRFCSQNCPYKVRRFNWFSWDWPEPLNLQLNPDVTVRSKGVMEKCSFCIQRIKEAHGKAKSEKRMIRDGEIQPACLQTCPTGVFTFGNLMDKGSRVRNMVADKRAYQAIGYLNTKPAVIYLKKVLQEI